MNEITLQCADTPDAPNANFLATLQPVNTSDEEDLPFEITLDRYTRESWSLLKTSNESIWKSTWFKSVDEKKRLPGFLKFLGQRKKAAMGKFESPYPDEVTGDINTALFLVPFEQPSEPDGVGGDLIHVKICMDERLAKVKPKPKPRPIPQQQQRRVQQRPNSVQSNPIKSSGILGNLLGATHRTNQHLNSVPARRKEKQVEDFNSVTSGQVITKFREKIEKMMNDFNSSPKTDLKVSISLSDLTKEMDSMEEKSKVTMDVMKYIVYEQAEETNEEWIAAKEPGEFMDEAIVAVYKAGYAPADVLEDINKGEMPDEVKQEQRAMRESREREERKKLKLLQEQNLKNATGRDDGVAALNTAKRDRRSIEEIQKDMGAMEKRHRME